MGWNPYRTHKYGAQKVEAGGWRYDSKLEASHGQELAIRQAAKEITDFKRQVRYRLEVNGQKICDHIVDFEITYPDGHIEVEEVKGFGTPEWYLKYKLFMALYPDIPYNVVTNNKKIIKKTSKYK